MDAKQKRNLIVVGHAQSGKTSLAESILFVSGTTSRKGTIADGNTLGDYSPEEVERKISISASILLANYQSHQIQIVDTPGYADFVGEVISSLRAVDAAIVVIDAVSGIEVGTESVWSMLEELNTPRIIFVNKMDKEGADFNKSILEIKENLSPKAIVVDALSSAPLMEAVAETDDKLLEKYLETGSLSEQEISLGLRQAVIQAKIFPLLSGSSFTDKGIKELLDAIAKFLPHPLERMQLKGINPKTKEPKEISPSEDGPFCAFVFKTISDPYVGQLTLLRIFRGKLISNTSFFNVNKATKERIGQIFLLQGKEQKPVTEASCGDILALSKLKDTLTNDSLTDEKEPVEFPAIIFPEPAISSSVKPKSRQDEDKISVSLSKLTTEDPTFKTTRDQETKELIISGIGDLHLNVMVERLKRRFNVEVELGTPKVSYKETITKSTKAQGKYKRQSGGRGQYGDVWIELEPLPKDAGEFEFVDKIFGGAIPRNYVPSVEKGIREAMQNGILSGYPLVGIRVTLVDGSFHPVDSSDIAFQIAARMALRKAEQEAGPVILEPIMDVEVVVSDEFMGQISGDLNSRRGRIMGMDNKGKLQVVKAQVPLAEMFTYANDLRSLTGGRATYSMKFSRYEQIPQKIAQNIIAQAQATRKKEEEE